MQSLNPISFIFAEKRSMQIIPYLIIYPILWLISILPFKLLYLLSDFIFVIMYYVIGYRKKVVRDNIKLALPNLSKEERLFIEKESYRHLCDMFLEMIKTMSISDEQIKERFQFTNLATYLELEKQGKSIALMCAHYASYEWVISMNKYIHYQGYAIYKRINNKYFDTLVQKIRKKFKAELIHNREASARIEVNESQGKKCVYGFASDQSPQVKNKTHWDVFMGIEVPVYTGAEFISKKYDMNMIYLKVKKVKRGYYEATFEVLSENVKSVPDYQITRAFLDKVEQQIREAPQYYLWTHKRWKHKGKNKN